MSIKLSAEWEALLQDRVRAGAYPTVEDAVAEALELLKARDELRQDIQLGVDEADRGELVDFDAEDIIAEGRRSLEARKRAG
jgi:antitoxin ParD1/3/4